MSNNTLTPRSAASAIYAGDLNALLLVVSNQADYCSALTAGQTHANHVALAAELLTMSATGETVPVTPGTYTIISDVPEAPGNYALAAFRASDSNCNDTLQDPADAATAGTVTVTAVSGATVSGSYNVTFPEGTVAGTFAAPACFALAAQAKDNPTLTCEP